MRKRNKIVLIFLIVLIISFFFINCNSQQKDTIIVAHKNYTEQRIIGEAIGQYLIYKGFDVEVKELGGTLQCFNALQTDGVDVYCEYTGTTYASIFNQTKNLGKDATYDYVKKRCEEEYGITWLEPLGFNNTYELVVNKDFANKNNLKNISDLKLIANQLVLGGDQEFPIREGDGYSAFIETYGFGFKEYKGMSYGKTAQTLVDGDVDILAYYSTDGRISKYNFVSLIDDKGVFPPYYCTPIMKEDFAKANSEVVDALNFLGNKFTDADMQKYNLMVDEGSSIKETATKMLQDKGLIK
ncbi:MAG: glycine betaine ABC transporter substrate-binding protein [Pleomorphochaeta sp.]